MRGLTAVKLSKQQANDMNGMNEMKSIRANYILAHDQLFFPLNIEVLKAETRVMSYLARYTPCARLVSRLTAYFNFLRNELRNFARNWDEVEMSLHFLTILAARLVWDGKVMEILDRIKQQVEETVGYMAENVRKTLMSREFRKPGMSYFEQVFGIIYF